MTKSPSSEPLVSDVVLRAAAIATICMATFFGIAALLMEDDPAATAGTNSMWLGCLSVVAAAGFIVAWARPRNVIGWLLLFCVLLQTASLVTSSYAQIQYASGHPRPESFLVASVAEWIWFPSLVIPVAVLPSLYPSGRAETRARRVFVWAGTCGIVGICVELGLVLGPGDLVEGLQLPYTAPEWVSGVLVGASALALAMAVLGGLSAAFVRMLRSSAPERQQLLLLLIALAPFPIAFFWTLPDGGTLYAFFGVAVAVGVLRYRLLNIDLVVRRALFYVPLIAVVALAVAVVSTAVARLAPSGPLPLLGAAAVVAVLVGPVSGWLRRTVDRFVLGDRADPLSAVGRVAAHGEASQDGALTSLLDALAEAVELPYAAVLDDSGRTLATVGLSSQPTEELELRAGGEHLGVLRHAPPVDGAGRRILVALAPHIATLLHTQRLAAEVELQRRRVDVATYAERERIRSDLHDSLGPSLSGIALGLQAVDVALVGDEPTARGILRRAREEADAAVREVRRALDALGPAALDRQRLDEAVRQAADRLGFDGARGPTFSCVMKVRMLPPEVADVAYRIIGEALHNVARHARASECAVSLVDHEGHIHLSIRDDGVGIGIDASRGMGMPSMRHRAHASGGTFAVLSRPETSGTVVDVDLPLGAPA
jgi:signal transduction histidine kinase